MMRLTTSHDEDEVLVVPFPQDNETEVDLTGSDQEDGNVQLQSSSSSKQEFAPMVLVEALCDEMSRLEAKIDKKQNAEEPDEDMEEIGKDTFSFFMLSTYPRPCQSLNHNTNETDGKDSDDNDDDTEEENASDKCCLPFWWATLILGTQLFIYYVVLAGSGAKIREDIPLGVTRTIRVAQCIALLITLLTQSDFADGVQLCMAHSALAQYRQKFYLSVGLRLVTGMLGIYTTFLLVMRSDEAVDLLLNFSAMEFVAELDGIGFALAHSGFFGRILKRKAQQVDQCKYNRNVRIEQGKFCGNMTDKNKRLMWKVIPYGAVFIFLFSGYVAVFHKQNQRVFEENLIYVQFSDKSWPKLPKYSGIYEGKYWRKRDGRDNEFGKIKYVKVGDDIKSPGFVYCREDGGTWMFDDTGNTPCKDINVKANVEDDTKPSDEYNLLSRSSAEWVYENSRSASKMEVTITEAKNFKELYTSMAKAPCQYIFDGDFWYEQTESSRIGEGSNKEENLLRLAQRPLYRSLDEGDGEFLYVVFNGYRWVFTESIDKAYDRPQDLLEKIRPDEIAGVSDPFRFMTPEDNYFPTGAFKWHAAVGFLPAVERGGDGSENSENTFSMYCRPKCEEGQQEVSFLVVTDRYPSEFYFTVFLDSFYEAWKAKNYQEMIPVYGSTSFDMKEAKAFRGGPYQIQNGVYTLFGCMNPQDKLNIGLFDTFADGFEEEGSFEIYVGLNDEEHNGEPVHTVTGSFSCRMLQLDVGQKNVTSAINCDDEQKTFMEDALINY